VERNANFAKEVGTLKEKLKDKIYWHQVDRVMGLCSSSSRTEEPQANDNVSGQNGNVSDQNLVIFLW
jgi:hypothetical protein